MAVSILKTTPNGAKVFSNGNVLTPEARFSFPSVFEATKPKGAPPEQKAKFGVTLLFKKDEDLSLMKEAVVNVLTEKFGAKDKWPKNIRLPFRDQGDKEYEGYEKGNTFIAALSTRKPGVVNAKAEYIDDESQVYPGCWGRCTVRAFWYEASGNKGVSFGLQNVQKTRDGESLGGRMRAEDEFDAVAGSDPMSGGAAGDDPLADMAG